jgi:biotin carboxyl carrier protein
MKHAITLCGRDYAVWLARETSDYELHIEDARVRAGLRETGENRYQLTLGGESVPLSIATDGDRVFVHVDGAVHELTLRDSVRRYADEAQDAGAHAAIAPMPGTVIDTPASPGDRIAPGDILIVIESMKLETAIKATHAGIVESVHVSVGQTFERDAILVSLKPAEAD